MFARKTRLLLIEDNKFDRMAFERLMNTERRAHDYTMVNSVTDALKILESKSFDVIISDYYLGDGTLFDVITQVKDTPVIVTTGVGNQDIAVKAMKEGAYDYLIKDLERNYLKTLPMTVENAINHKRAEERYRMLSHATKCINDSIYITDMNDRIIFVNKVFCKTYGYKEKDILGKRSKLLWPPQSIKEDFPQILSKIDEFGWKSELTHRRKDGTVFPISLARSIIHDDDDNEVAVVAVAHDITERKQIEEVLKRHREQLEELIAEQTAEVRKSNQRLKNEISERKKAEKELANYTQRVEDSHQQLQQFENVVSHGLEEPLNQIQVFCRRINSELQNDLNEPCRNYLERIQETAANVQTTVSDLLTHLCVTPKTSASKQVDLAELTKQVLSDLQQSLNQRGARVELAALPPVDADPDQIRKLLKNLISNLLQLYPNDQAPDLRISGEMLNGKTTTGVKNTGSICKIIIEDNVTQHSRVHPHYDGTEMSLNMCREIVERHGGTINVDSSPGHGTTFVIMLPVNKPNTDELTLQDEH